ncbi:MFS transporter [Reyranella sp. CPCC 100927]|uniref:MFS transporter n=1 Tax=Reyranella sp. CPCC 100927 TaxID=2599616 RepID=UPI0011B387E2|nr:MFS transporter [Reyranella sp. CPCC 100927]TWT02825.1 MFS transporter [Reyranella sp. CPCC 100927]
MLAQQTCATVGRSVIPLIAPAIVASLDISAALVGVYLSLSSAAAFLSTLGCGGFILRYGALRITQVGMLFLGGGLGLCATGSLAAFVPGALAGGLGQAVSTPSSSHILGRYAPPRLAPLIFSLKQTGVPAGLMLGGILAPALVERVGWQATLLCIAAICAGTAVALQPLRERFDTDRNPAQKLSPADMRSNALQVLRDPALRLLCFTMFSFVGLQALFTGFFVLYLVEDLQHDLANAGLVFSIAVAVAVPARIGWGWVASRLVRPGTLLAALAIAMSAAAAGTAAIHGQWPFWAIAAVTMVFSATAVSWHGVLLAEVARLSPSGRIGSTTGVVLAFGDAGSLLLPLVFSAMLVLAGSYRVGFLIGALPALVVGLYSLRARVRTTAERTAR